MVVIVVSTSTVGGAIEERYVMYVYTPIAVLAVAGLPHIHRIALWLIPGGAAALYILAEGFALARPGRRKLLRGSRGGLLDTRRPASPGRSGGRSARVAVDRRQRLAARRSRSCRDVDLHPCGPAPRSHARDRSNTRRRSRALRDRPGAGVELRLRAGAVRHGRRPGRHRAVARPRQRPRHLARRPAGRGPRHCGHAGRGFELGPRGVAPRCCSSGTRRPIRPLRSPGTEPFCRSRPATRLWRPSLAPTVSPRGRPAGVAGRPPRRSAGSVPGHGSSRGSPLCRYALYRTASSQRALWTSTGLQPDGAVLRATPVGMTLDPPPRAGRAGWSRSRCARPRARPARCASP